MDDVQKLNVTILTVFDVYVLFFHRTKSLCEVTFETIPQTFTMIIIAANTALAQIDSSLYFYSLSASFLNLFWQLSLIYTGGKQTQLGMKQYVWKFYIMQGVDMLPFQNAIIQNNISELKIREALSEKEWNSLIDSLFFNFTIVDFDIKGVKLHNPTWVKLFASLDNNNLATLNLADCKIFDPDIMKSNHESRSRQLPSAWAAANDDDDESQKSKSNSKQQSSGSDDLAENDLENELDNEFQMRANESGMRSPQMSLLAKLAPIIEARLSKQSDDNIDNVETDAHQTMDTSHRSSTMPTETDNTRASSMRASEMIKIAIDQPHDPRVTEWLENNFRDRTVSAMLVQSKAIQDSGNVSAAKQRLTNIELELLDMKQHQQDMTVKQQTARTNEALRSLLRHLSKTLLTLDLSCNHLSSSFGVITPQISKMSRLKELYLSNNNLGSIEFTPRQLVTLFRGLKQLVIIDFSNNNLTDYHVEKFIFAFEKLKKLTEKKNRKASTLSQYSVDLQMTDTNEVGTSTIETNIEQNNENTNLIYLTHLKTLDLSENKITFAGATKLFNVLKSYNDLSIVLNGNDIEDCDFNKLVVHAAVSSLL